MRRLLAAGLLTGVAAWLSQGTLAFATNPGPRIGILPLSITGVILSGLAGAATVVLMRGGASPVPLWLLTLVVLPWLPLKLPPVLLVWSGPLKLLVWLGIAALMVAESARRRRGEGRAIVPARVAAAVRTHPQITAGLVALLLFGGAAWIAAPTLPIGDEPHYLVITQSLLLDGDLRVENNYRRGDHLSFYFGDLEPHFMRRGADGQIYSVHSPGLPALVAPAFAVAGHAGTRIFLIALAALGSALMWHVTWLATRDAAATWIGWASVVLSATTILHSFAVFPDGVAGVIVLTGIWALLRARTERRNGSTASTPWLLHGAVLAMLPWLHTRLAPLGGCLGALVLLRLATTRNASRKAAAFLAVPAVAVVGWIGLFVALYGTPDPSAPYGGLQGNSPAFIAGGFAGLLFDQRFGLLANAPVLLCAVCGFGVMRGRTGGVDVVGSGETPRRLALDLLFVVAPYLLIVTSFAMWWGGTSAPARFAAAILPILAIPCAFGWASVRARATRFSFALALVTSGFISAVLLVPERGQLAFNTRHAYGLWFEWASGLADLARGMPDWFVDGGGPRFFLDVAIWLALFVGTWIALKRAGNMLRLRPGSAFATVVALAYAAAGMLALATTWTLHGFDGAVATPAQLNLLRKLATEPSFLGLQLNPPALLPSHEEAARLRIHAPVVTSVDPRENRPLLELPAIPAGRYRVRPRTQGQGGQLMLGIERGRFLVTESIAAPPAALEVDFPVYVRALVVGSDEVGRQVVRSLDVEPVSVVPAADRLTSEFARRAFRYGSSSFYFVDDRSFPDGEWFWVGGARSSTMVVSFEEKRAGMTLHLRNVPVRNTVTIRNGRWRGEVQLEAGEERTIRVPLDANRNATLLTIQTSSGYRPVESEPDSRDDRFLGVRVRPGT